MTAGGRFAQHRRRRGVRLSGFRPPREVPLPRPEDLAAIETPIARLLARLRGGR